jgi:hypothetical protein
MVTRYAYIDPETGLYTESNQRPEARLCDFCSGQPIDRLDATENHSLPLPAPLGCGPTLSTGGWAACRACAELIDGGRRDDLLDRAFKAMQHKLPVPPRGRATLRGYIARLQDSFWAASKKRVN